MAKDGTTRGGMRIGSGRKKKSLEEKLLEGKVSSDKIQKSHADVDDFQVPALKNFMTAKQRNGEKLFSEEIYSEIWQWLKKNNCENLVDNQLIEQYVMSVARWRQCEEYISKLGLIGEHPTTGGEMISVYVKMSQDYQKQINQLRYQIYSVVKENSSVDCSIRSDGDKMETLLRSKKRI